MKQKVLLVDDRQENLLVLQSTLENDTLEFITADSGESALRQILRNDVSLILLDVQMPGMDGFEAAGLIHGNPQTKHIPIIFISAINKEQKHIFRGYASGAIDYLFKPFDPDILRAKVTVLLELDRQRRTMAEQNAALQLAKKNTDSILQNVKEGLFLMDRDFCIYPEYSRALEDILGRSDIGRTCFPDIIREHITAEEHAALLDYLGLCFDPDTDDNVLIDLNPLLDIEFNFTSGKIGRSVKYLSFDSRRIYHDEKISQLIFTVNDHTEHVLLKKKLAVSEEQSKKQMEWFFSILHVDPKLLKDFVDSTEQSLLNLQERYGTLSRNLKDKTLLEEMYRCLHQIKGNAAILNLEYFMLEAHQTEEIITGLQKSNPVKIEDIEPLQEHFDNFHSGISEINRLIAKLSQIYQHFRPKRKYEIEMLLQSIKNLIDNLSRSDNKDVELVYENFNGISIPYNCRLNLKDILVQLIRNAIIHGIESPIERKKAGKPKKGKIEVTTFKTDNSIGFKLSDDGRGLQFDRLKKVAEKSGNWSKKEIAMWNKEKLCSIIFLPGITTSAQAGIHAGRGIGMDLIQKMVNEQSGSISVRSEPGRYTEFTISFPTGA